MEYHTSLMTVNERMILLVEDDPVRGPTDRHARLREQEQREQARGNQSEAFS